MYNMVVTNEVVSIGLDRESVNSILRSLSMEGNISDSRFNIRNCDIVAFVTSLALCKYGGVTNGEIPNISLGSYGNCDLSGVFEGTVFTSKNIELSRNNHTYRGCTDINNIFEKNRIVDIIANNPCEFISFVTATKMMDILNLHRLNVGLKTGTKHVSGVYSTPVIVRTMDLPYETMDFVNAISSVPKLTGEIVIPMGNTVQKIGIVLDSVGNKILPNSEQFRQIFDTMQSTLSYSRNAMHMSIARLEEHLSTDIDKVKRESFNRGVKLLSIANNAGWEIKGDGTPGYLVYDDRVEVDRVLYKGNVVPLPDELRGVFWLEDITIPIGEHLSSDITAKGVHPHRCGFDDGINTFEEISTMHNQMAICIGDLGGKPIERFVLIPEQMRCVSTGTAYGNTPQAVVEYWMGRELLQEFNYEETVYDEDNDESYNETSCADIDYAGLGLGEAICDRWGGILLDLLNDDDTDIGEVYSGPTDRAYIP